MGDWQQAYPKIAVGLKRGFTFHHHVLGAPGNTDAERQDQLLVAASPRDAIADTHWYRADFDQLLVEQAQELGVAYLDQTALHGFEEDAGRSFAARSTGRPRSSVPGKSRDRCNGAARISASRSWARREGIAGFSADTGSLFAFLRGAASGKRPIRSKRRRRAAISGRRCCRSPYFRWRLDLGAAVQQRNCECRCGSNRCVRVTVTIGGRASCLEPAPRSNPGAQRAIFSGDGRAALHAYSPS